MTVWLLRYCTSPTSHLVVSPAMVIGAAHRQLAEH